MLSSIAGWTIRAALQSYLTPTLTGKNSDSEVHHSSRADMLSWNSLMMLREVGGHSDFRRTSRRLSRLGDVKGFGKFSEDVKIASLFFDETGIKNYVACAAPKMKATLYPVIRHQQWATSSRTCETSATDRREKFHMGFHNLLDCLCICR